MTVSRTYKCTNKG